MIKYFKFLKLKTKTYLHYYTGPQTTQQPCKLIQVKQIKNSYTKNVI